MIFSEVRLPDKVGVALEEGRLVIFAGAGISIPPPSNLPSFNGLARQITGRISIPVGKEEYELGNAHRTGTDVHSAAGRILYHERTHPTELHKQILGLFGTVDQVRIVTTNFDNHFSSAARILFGRGKVVEYCGPALPLGDNFSGIVYLHGSARVNTSELVLTDSDFGAAYLTRGWARDFLISLFSTYTVLFVGYSHSDVTINYLARGLNQTQIKPRLAFVPSDLTLDDREHWEHYGIELELYPLDKTDNDNVHHKLTGFFTSWAEHSKETILHRAKKVKTLAMALPPENQNDSEYLDYCLRHYRLAQEFCAAIRHPAWLGWMHDRGYFKEFFEDTCTVQRSDELQPNETELAKWLSISVRKLFPELLLAVIKDHRQRLTRPFAYQFAQALWIDNAKTPDPRFAVWVSILLSQHDCSIPQPHSAFLLQQCKIPEHAGVAMRLLELLTEPAVRLRNHWDFSEVDSSDVVKKDAKSGRKIVDFEIMWPEGSEYWLKDAWQKTLRPNLVHLAEPLSLLATKQLTAAHLLLEGVCKSTDAISTLSWERSSIATHEQNRDLGHVCLSLLIDIARDVLIHWFAESNSLRARAQMELWWSSKYTLLRRLTAYGVSIDPNMSGDERIQWLLSNELIFSSRMKKEVFDILAVSYQPASETMKRKLVRRIKRGLTAKQRKRLEPRTCAYEQFNVLAWLRRADAGCVLVQDAIFDIKELYPEFEEREHPNFDVWSGPVEWIDPKEGFDFDRILSEPPVHYLSAMRTAENNSTHQDRESYLTNLSVLFGRSQDWGRRFMEVLAISEITDSELWMGVFRAWREYLRDNHDWEWILSVIEDLPQDPGVMSAAANLISNAIWNREERLSESVISRAAVLIDTTWEVCSTVQESPDYSYRDWLTSAINDVGGWIGLFWIHYCSDLRIQAGESWEGIPSTLKSMMRGALKGTGRTAVYARIAMIPYMGHIFAWDRDFAVENFLPLLDWQRDPVVAQQSWSVLLSYGGPPSTEMQEQLLPYYRQFAERMTDVLKGATVHADQFDERALGNLGYYLSGLGMNVIANPLESGFFREFLPLLPETVRVALAQGMGHVLKSMSPGKTEAVWTAWLMEYLDQRLLGIPVALSTDETKAMVEWCLDLSSVFPAAVQRIVQMPLRNIVSYGIIDRLLASPVLESFPKEACVYATAILNSETYPLPNNNLSILEGKLKETISGTSEFRDFEELLYLRGWKQ